MRIIRFMLLLLLLSLLAGCQKYWASPPAGQGLPTEGVLPTEAVPPTVEAYPPPQGWTPEPTETPEPTPTPTVLPVPVLQVQPLAAEWGKGERIAFLKDGDLWLVRPDGSAQAQVTTSGNATALYGWSYDCTRLLLGVGERPVLPETDMPGGKDLWVVWADGSKAEPLVQGLEVLEARWSPVDERLAYRTRDKNLYLLSADSKERHPLIDNHTSAWLTPWPWSFDGRFLILHKMPSPDEPGFVNLAVTEVDTGKVWLLTTGPYSDLDAIWSLDGREVLFRSNRQEPYGKGRSWLIQADGQNLRLVGGEELGMADARVSRSPVSDQVAFWYVQPGSDTPTVWVMDFDGSNLRELAEGSSPAWSPDGKRVAYTDPQGALWVINLDGTGAHQIVEADRNPLWYEPFWCR